MNLMKKKLPIGIEDFEEVIKEDFYYVDKTGLIAELLQNWGYVNLFTRPRRFGKSLNMSMLKHFFSIEGDKTIFDGLTISKEKALCDAYMGKYPVISISLKGVNAPSYETAFQLAVQVINEAAAKVQFVLDSNKLTEYDKSEYRDILSRDMNEAVFSGSLRKLSGILEKYYGTKVIILIDEYDVPLAKAFENGYYDQMIFLIRNLFEQALKTNSSLKFAVMTGCMRISKESIFTGLNNFNVFSIVDVEFDEYFGFKDTEVRALLEYYKCEDKYSDVKEWYDGYRFGNSDVYCPWDVICYCGKLRMNPDSKPQNYWINTSSNDAVKKFIEKSENVTTKREIERLVSGETIVKKIRPELTYKDMYDSIENIWSVLFTTGYLTQKSVMDDNTFELGIPNKEIYGIFTSQIMDYFKKRVQRDGETAKEFCEALEKGNIQIVENIFKTYLKNTISIRDTFVKREMKENFYHGILLGVLSVKETWGILSNRESGDGYSDILIETDDGETGIIIEIKYAHDGNLERACEKALKQIKDMEYERELLEEGEKTVRKYAIACYKKTCKIMLADK